jgi:hypothetical protein
MNNTFQNQKNEIKNNWRKLQSDVILETQNKTREKIKRLKSGYYSGKDIKVLIEPFLLRNNEYWGFVQELVEPISESGMVEMNMRLIKFRVHELGTKYIDITTERNSSGFLPTLKLNK